MNQDLVEAVRQQKRLARRNQSVGRLVTLAGALAWVLPAPADAKPKLVTALLFGSVAGTAIGLFVLHMHHAALFPCKAACPACGHDWEIKEGRAVLPMERMPNWDKCPGCGLLMNERLLARRR